VLLFYPPVYMIRETCSRLPVNQTGSITEMKEVC